MKNIILLSCLFLSSLFLFAQESSSRQKSYTKEANFFKAQRKTERRFRQSLEELKKETLNQKEKNEAAEEIEEYAEFKRWQYFWRDRVFNDGKYPSPAFLYSEFQKSNSVTKRTRNTSTSNWNCISQTYCYGGYEGMGRTTCTAFHPTDSNIFYVGSPNGGIWKTIDGGLNYIPLGDQLPFVSAGSILVDPSNPDILYVSTGDAVGWWNYNAGVYKSTDGGATWNPTGLVWQLSAQNAIYNMAFLPGNSAKIFVASTGGLYLSSDSGQTFQIVKTGSVNDIEFKPGSSTEVYCSTDDYWGSSELFYSNDAGNIWNQLSSFNNSHNFLKLAVTPANPDVLAVYSSINDEVYLSTNSGNTLNLRSSGAPGNAAFFISPQNADVIFCGNVNVSRSVDGGMNWTTITNWYDQPPLPEVHADLHNICYSPLHPDDIYFNNDGGLYRYKESTDTWKELSDNLVITQFYSLANSQTDASFIIGGTQDNGGRKRNFFGAWDATNGGDAMETAVDPVNDQIIYTTYVNGKLYRSMDQWVVDTYHEITPEDPSGISLIGDWVTPYLLNPQNSKTIIAAYDDVYLSTDRGNNWTQISTNLAGGSTLQELAVAPSDSMVIYTSIDNVLYTTTDQGANWTSSTLSGNERITSILVHPSDPNTVWVSRGGFGDKIFKSNNSGTTFTDVSGSLPNVPANCLFYEPGSVNGIYVGTDLGVFYINDLLADWIPFNDGLPAVEVTDFSFFPATSKLRVSTYGRGIWENDLYSIATGISTLHQEKAPEIFPNPSNEFVTISFPTDLKNQQINLNVFDSRGSKVYEKNITLSTQSINLETKNFANGVYFVQLMREHSNPVTLKFVVEHK